MPTTKTIVLRALFVLAALGLSVVACQGPEAFYRPARGEGGSFGTGGTGLVGSGGATGTGGIVVTGTGGTPATGGTTGTGGKPPAAHRNRRHARDRRHHGHRRQRHRRHARNRRHDGHRRQGHRWHARDRRHHGHRRHAATGGTTGTGGTPATGGTTGTGGAAATGLVVVDTDCQSATSVQSIGLYLDVLNTSSAAIPLSQITFRYYFQVAETTDPPHLDIDYSTTVPAADITAKFVAISPAVTGANEYMEVGFTAGRRIARSDSRTRRKSSSACTRRTTPTRSTPCRRPTTRSRPAPPGRTANTGSFAAADDHHRVRQRRPGVGHRTAIASRRVSRNRSERRAVAAAADADARVEAEAAAPSTPALFGVASRGRRCAGSSPPRIRNDRESRLPPRGHIARDRFLRLLHSPSGRPPACAPTAPAAPPPVTPAAAPAAQPAGAGHARAGAPAAPAAAVVSDWNAAPTNGSPASTCRSCRGMIC